MEEKNHEICLDKMNFILYFHTFLILCLDSINNHFCKLYKLTMIQDIGEAFQSHILSTNQ